MVPRYCAVAPMDGPCCRSWARPDRSTIPGITREGFAASPAECEATCFATTGCQAFSHSFTQRQCVLCSDCGAARRAAAKSRDVFTSWRRQREGETFATLADAVDVAGLRFWPGHVSAGNLSRTVAPGACVAPRPCAAGALAVAIVLRGETFRWGCDAFGVAKQRQAAAAYDAMLASPLERRGHCVHLVLAIDRGCPSLDAALVAMHGDRVALAQRIRTEKQPANARAALDLLLSRAEMASRYDMVILARHDVQLLSPLDRWACALAQPRFSPTVLSVGSRCDPRAWRSFNCSSDLFYAVPRALLAAFSKAIGTSAPARAQRQAEHCCFSSGCLGQGGHGCLNLLAPAMGGAGGTDGTVASMVAAGQVDFCWPPMRFKVSEWNHNYHVPQCADLPGRKPGSIWRCRTPALSTGRPYLEEANAKHAGRGPRQGEKNGGTTG